jgi:phosphoribosylamine--glycine ligase
MIGIELVRDPDSKEAFPRAERVTERVLAAARVPGAATCGWRTASGTPFTGALFAGLMIAPDGEAHVLEYNVRFGDPECQVLMLRLMSDLVPALLACCDGMLKNFDLRWYAHAALSVVMAARGYPGSYAKGSVIEGLDAAAAVEGVEIFHAGTLAQGGCILANGGRVLDVSAVGKTVAQAQGRAYAAVDRIRWSEGFCRRDIGHRAVEREAAARNVPGWRP